MLTSSLSSTARRWAICSWNDEVQPARVWAVEEGLLPAHADLHTVLDLVVAQPITGGDHLPCVGRDLQQAVDQFQLERAHLCCCRFEVVVDADPLGHADVDVVLLVVQLRRDFCHSAQFIRRRAVDAVEEAEREHVSGLHRALAGLDSPQLGSGRDLSMVRVDGGLPGLQAQCAQSAAELAAGERDRGWVRHGPIPSREKCERGRRQGEKAFTIVNARMVFQKEASLWNN